jgi:hypothetical protein
MSVARSQRSTIGRGLKDLDAAPLPKGRVRRKSGGRRHLSSRDATLIEDLRQRHRPARRAQLQRYFYRGRVSERLECRNSFTPACKPPWTGSPSDIPLV